jgi:hypothetical protein
MQKKLNLKFFINDRIYNNILLLMSYTAIISIKHKIYGFNKKSNKNS